MGIFDRFTRKVERDNTAAVLERELERMDGRIAEHVERIASLKVQRLHLEREGKGGEAGYAELIEQAERILVELRDRRRALDHERMAAPAAKAVAEARVALHDDATGLGASATSAALGSVRDDIDALNRKAHPGLLDADGIPIEGRRAALSRKDKERKARAELERLKAAMGAPSDSDEP